MSAVRLRTVVIGFGRIAAGYAADPLTARYYRYATHAQALRNHPVLDWMGVADPAAEALLAARREWGIPHGCLTVRELAAECEPEVAVLATPPGARLQAVRELPSLRAVLVEKPLGRTDGEAEEFLRYCESRGILVQVNYWRRADEQYRRLASGLLRELVGEPQAVSCIYGGGLRNNGTHAIDFIRMLLGEISSVHAMGPQSAHGRMAIQDDLDVAFGMRMANGAAVSCLPIDFSHYREVGFDIWGTKGRFSIMQEGLWSALFRQAPHRAIMDARETASDRPQSLETTIGEALRHMHDNLAEAILTGAPLFSPGRSALKTENAVEAVLASIGGGGVAVGTDAEEKAA